MGRGLDKAYEIQISLEGRDQKTIGNDRKQSRLISLLSKDPAELVSLGSEDFLCFRLLIVLT